MTQPAAADLGGAALMFAVLGDSIAYGQGAARADDTVGRRLVRGLRAGGASVELRVYAVPGARSESQAGQVRRALPHRPAVVLIIIGANDLTHFVAPDEAAAHLEAAVRTLRAAGAHVVVAPAPDLSAIPWVPAQARAAVKARSDLLRAAQTRAALAAGARVADVEGETARAFVADPALFSADRFHPSSAGYAVITDALRPAIEAAMTEARGAS